MPTDGETLSKELHKALGWERSVIDGVVQAVAQAVQTRNTAEIEEIITDFLGGDPRARAAVEAYTTKLSSRMLGPKVKGNMVQTKKNVDNEVFGPSISRSTASVQAPPSTSRTMPVSNDVQQTGNMKLVTGRTGKKALPNAAPRPDAILKAIKPQVFNCLSCGKIYDCNRATVDNLTMARSGVCTFCDSPLKITYGPGFAPTPPDPTKPQALDPSAPLDAATEKAIEFKNRLVDYDRNAAKRTNVIDDQSDFFEINNNAWLDEDEREVLKQRQRLEEDLSAARKNRVVVTIDLMGRQVHMADRDSRSDAEVGFIIDEAQQKASIAASHARDSMPQGGGTGAASADVVARGAQPLRQLHMSANPQLSFPAPVFLPSTKTRPSPSNGPSRRTPVLEVKRPPAAKGVWSKRGSSSRVAADEDVFEQFAEDVQVLFTDTQEAEDAAMATIAEQFQDQPEE